ncbi:hypothetical protein D9611_008005 [Ephemerocybe angulata]|uniref:Ubiquitin-like protease family profile domain-containing protein n=1 Tax=Ephemerocybe angulata TaxID=980116 RepID=A0A8H5BZW6_9AGAR|nr:hypothetical protein D9611_008005 [Tulosesus angulatus]
MSRKKAFHTKPCLQPSTTLHSLNLPAIAATFFLLALLLGTTLSSQQFINFIILHSLSTSASSTVIGILILIFYFLLYYHVARPNDLFVLVRTILGYRRRYHRSHVYHMRIDRLRKIMKTQGFRIPQIFELPRHGRPPRSASHLYDLADFVCSRPNLADSNNHLWLALRTFLEHGSLPPRHGGGIGRAQAEPEATAPSAWLDRVETLDNTELVDECRELLARLPAENKKFKLSVPGVSLYPRELVAFLGDTWLDDSAIYAGCRYLRYHVSDPTIAFADTFHLPLLKKERETSLTYTPRHTELDESLLPGADQPVTRVFLPLHVHGAHWTLFYLDLEAGTYSYADCLWRDETPPLEDLEIIFWWLNGLGIDVPSLRRVPFESLLRTAFGDDSDIVLPVQKDSSSCGVIVLNLMAALLLNRDIWSQDRAAHERLMWFIRLAQDVPTYESDVDSDVDSDDEDGPSDDTGNDSTEGDSDWVQVSQPHSPTSRNAVSGSSTLPSSSMPSIPSSPTGSSFPRNSSTLGKRRHKVAVSLPPFSRPQLLLSDDSEFSDSGESRYLKRRRRHVGPRAGTSWARQKDLKARSKDKEFKAHRMKLDNFRSKIRVLDSHAEFQAEDPIAVRCSACTQWIYMRALYDTLRFSEHRGSRKCRGLQATGMVSKSLWSMGFVYKKSVRSTATCMVPVPCPGLTRQSDPRIDNYLARTSVPNGGAPSRTALARNLFGVDAQWSGLTKKQRRMVLRREKSLAVWRNMHDIEAVFSTVCTTTVYCGSDCDPPPCEACDALYKVHTFQVAIRRPLPKEVNMKFTPKAYRCSQLGEIYLKYTGVRELMEKDDGKSPWLKFAVGVVEGKYDSDVLLGMVEAFIAKADRLEKGKSLRNMKYSSAFSDFCDVIACLSPVTYRTFQEHFGGRSMESMRRIRARGPRFQPGFSPENVAAVADLLEKYDYEGPLSLSWDDTELAPAVSIYQESKDVCVIIGGGDDVVRVGPGDDIDAVLSNAELTKATKLRIWLLTIPIPKIPPILIAALPTDLELAHASDAAFDEASQLLSYLNISATKFLAKYVAPPSQQRPAAAPSPQQTIASLLSLYDNTWRGKDITKCELAIAAESAAKSQEIEELPETLPEDVEAIKGLLSSMCLDIVPSTSAVNAVNLFSPLSLVDDSNTLQIDAVVAERAQHETEFARRAVRKTANAPIIMEMNARTLARAFTEGLTLREQLTSKLKEIEVEVVTEARRTGGVGRQIRHTGTFAGHLTTTQAETKATVKGAAATKFLQLRDKALAPLRGYAHENLPTANISPINPLSQGQLVIALLPSLDKGGITEVFLGEVVTSYSKGNGKNAKHDWATGIENLGVASYIYVRKFVPLAGDSVFTALSCPELSTVTLVQVPRTHLLFSLGTFTISRGQSVSVNGFDYGVLNLCATSTALFTTLRNRRGLLSECIRVLKALVAGKDVGPTTAFVMEAADETESERDD